MSSAVEVVRAWHEAVNERDVDAALALCAADVAVGGPRGTGHGHDVMRAWLLRSGIELVPQHDLTEVEGRVLVHEKARWTTTADAPVQLRDAPPLDTWVVFEVDGGLVTSVARFETAHGAEAAAAP